ncbi:LytR family transcriptional regulator, partial [Streptomyces sp. G35A]
MDAQGRGRAEDMDPADQWVLNPATGEYELRTGPSASRPAVPGARRPAPPGTGDTARGRTRIPGREVPP